MAFRLAALLIGLAPLLAVESTLRLGDLARPDRGVDPFVGFSDRWPLFVRDASGAAFVIPPAHGKFFRPARFPAVKPPGEYRVFVVGGSTVQGSPFAVETSFTTWLEIGLNALDPSRRWRVVNCGGISYATYRLAPIVDEILAYEPDLIILGVGHNEFLEDRTYASWKAVPGPLRAPLDLASRLRTFQALRTLVGVPEREEPPARLGPEVRALLDYEGGLEAYRRDDAWRARVVEHFAYNLRRMVATARGAGVPVVLFNPVASLDHPPFKSQHREGLSAAQIARFDELLGLARQRYRDDLPAAVALLEEARAIDDRHAGLHYTLAKCRQALGRPDEARTSFLRAKEEDVCPLRILEPMAAIVREVADEAGVPLFDAQAFFEARSRGGITGGDWLVDHVHPSIEGHRAWAGALIELLAREGIAHPNPARTGLRNERERAHLSALPASYFLLGEKRLGNQRLWAEGRGNLARPADLAPGPLTAGPDAPVPLDPSPAAE